MKNSQDLPPANADDPWGLIDPVLEPFDMRSQTTEFPYCRTRSRPLIGYPKLGVECRRSLNGAQLKDIVNGIPL